MLAGISPPAGLPRRSGSLLERGWVAQTERKRNLFVPRSKRIARAAHSLSVPVKLPLDNFIISYNDALIPPENLSAVPEPTTISLFLFVLMLAVAARRYRQAATVPV
jgi:hypothetical protein